MQEDVAGRWSASGARWAVLGGFGGGSPLAGCPGFRGSIREPGAVAGTGRQQATAPLRMLSNLPARQLSTGSGRPGARPGLGLHAGRVTEGPGNIVRALSQGGQWTA